MRLFRSNTSLPLLSVILLAITLPLEGQGTVIPDNREKTSCIPQFEGKHYNTYCLDNTNSNYFPAPQIISSCGDIKDMSYEEHYEELGCTISGFNGYFDPSRWTVSKIYGDGGVDVTGAPNALQVEGAGNALVNAEPESMTRMQILVPAGGILSFDWSNVGGSNFFPSAFQVMINERPVPLSQQQDGRGHFRSLVKTGDQLTLAFQPETHLTVEMENLRLLTNAIGAVRRTWTATDDQGRSNVFTQFITIEQPSIAEVIFPEDLSGVPATPEAISPKATGFPYIDTDGDPSTTEDRYQLQSGNCAFQIDYIDEVQQLSDGCLLMRNWIIRDNCGDNTMRETQIIKLSGAPASGDCPGDILYPAPDQDMAKPNSAVPAVSSKTYSAEWDHWDPEGPMTF